MPNLEEDEAYYSSIAMIGRAGNATTQKTQFGAALTAYQQRYTAAQIGG
jgi:hypothetical protein